MRTVSQGQYSYLITLRDMMLEMGKLSGKHEYTEGWIRHLHLGLGPEEFDPLTSILFFNPLQRAL